jgi:hypothetical protein
MARIGNLKNIIRLMLLIVAVTSCHPRDPEFAVIKGELSNGARVKLVLSELGTKDLRPVDSAMTDDAGRFSFTIKPAEAGFYMLRDSTGKVMVMQLGKGDTLILSGDFSDFPDRILLHGSEDAEALHAFFTITHVHEKQVDSLELLLAERQDSSGYYALTQSLDTVFSGIWNRQRDLETRFILAHPGSLASLIVLNYSFGMNPVLSPAEDTALYQLLDSTLMQAYPENSHVLFHHRRILEFRRQQEVKRLKN